MAKLTWLGEDDTSPDGEPIAGPSFTVWGGIKYPKGVAIDVVDSDVIARAKRNQFFTVEDGEPVKRGPGRPPKVKTDDDENAV